MNLFNEAIYKNHLEHTAEGTKWGKHKYLYITPSGRYVYPEDIRNGQSANQFRSRQINDQIKSAHSNATSSKMDLTPGSELKARQKMRDLNRGPEGRRSMRYTGSTKDIEDAHRRDQYITERTFGKGPGTEELERQIQKTAERKKQNEVAKTSGMAAGSNKVSTPANRNSITIKKTEEKKADTTTENKDDSKYKNMSEETKQMLLKDADKKEGKSSGKKGSGGKKKGSSSKKASTKTEEANQMGLSDDDLKNMEVNTEATNRDEVLKNIALRVIRGDYGNGADRKAKLGNYYDEVQKRVNELMKSGQINREGQSSQPTSQKTEQKASGSSTKEYKREDYKKGDKDFDDKNYSDKNRLGNTDFFSYKRDDGKYVILEEDMKWVVDEKPSSKMIKNLEAMDEYIDARQKNGTWEGKNAAKEWDQLASIAINGGDLTKKAEAEKAKVKNKKSVKHYDLEEGLFLKHWGKKRRSGRYRFGSGDRPYQHEARRRNSTFRDRRSMSNEDLDAAITRARKEVELYRAERDNRSQGQRFVEDVITSVGKDVLRTAGKGALLWAGKNFATKVLNNGELGEFIARGGPKKDKNK